MGDVTEMLNAIDQNKLDGSARLLPLVYEELRKLATRKLAMEDPGQTLQATALVHEAYLRLDKGVGDQAWDSRGHFFSAAAQAMRRILVENARRKRTMKHGGDFSRVELIEQDVANPDHDPDILLLNDAIDQLELDRPDAARVANLRYFAGLSIQETALHLNTSVRTVNRHWAYAKAFLYRIVNP